MDRIGATLKARYKRGFTLVEILIVAPVLLLMVIFMGSILITMYGNVVVESHKVLLRAEAQKLAASLKSDLSGSIAFTDRTDVAAIDRNAPEGGWIFNTKPPTLIAKLPAYVRDTGPAGASIAMREPDCKDAAYFNHVYFTGPSQPSNFLSLYRRTVVPAGDTLCSTIEAAGTCPADKLADSCAADELLSDRIADFSVTYLDDEGQPIDVNSAQSPLTPDHARAVKLRVTIGEVAYGKSIKESATVLINRQGR